jgi:hypothetical protein
MSFGGERKKKERVEIKWENLIENKRTRKKRIRS